MPMLTVLYKKISGQKTISHFYYFNTEYPSLEYILLFPNNPITRFLNNAANHCQIANLHGEIFNI